MSLENDRVVEPLSRWIVEPSNCRADWKCHAAYILVSASTNFTFQWCCCSNRSDRLDSAPTAELNTPCSRSTPGDPLVSHMQRRRFTCKLIFNPNTANSLYGTALTLLSQQQVSSELSALSCLFGSFLVSFLLVFVFHYLFDYYANLLTIQMTIKGGNTLRLSFTKHVYGLWNLLLSLSLKQMWVLLYYIFFWVDLRRFLLPDWDLAVHKLCFSYKHCASSWKQIKVY